MAKSLLAAIRFGYGQGPRDDPPDASALFDALPGPDPAAEAHPMLDLAAARVFADRYRTASAAARDGGAEAEAARKALREEAARHEREALALTLARILDAPAAARFRERLVQFWTNHFTAVPKGGPQIFYLQPYLHETLRRNLTGRFVEMLTAVAQSPLMLTYLDQVGSVGPNSRAGLRQGRGLNENLAREMLELHTLGVGGGYAQDDVRQLAELLTGFDFQPRQGFVFRENFAEPGAETVLGVPYGGEAARIDDALAALEALSLHPHTARHLARKLAVHFVADAPPQDLVDALATAWTASGGDLLPVYAALLGHPAAGVPELAKIKQPFDFMASALLALGLDGAAVARMPGDEFQRHIARPMRLMGQRFFRPPGPDGWPEEAEAWITPQGLSSRIRWSLNVPRRLTTPLPDPRTFAGTVLGDLAPARLAAAVAAAESEVQGVALVLSSPTFNRR